MRFLSTTLLAISALAGLVCAAPQPSATGANSPVPSTGTGGPPNPISYPTTGTTCTAGKPCTITWQPTSGKKVTLKLRHGDSGNLETPETIASDIDNTGSYTWTPSKDLKGDGKYAIEIVDDKGVSNYSPQFTLESNGSGLSSSTTKSASATTVAKSTATTVETTGTKTEATTATATGTKTPISTYGVTNSTHTITAATATATGTSTSTGTTTLTATKTKATSTSTNIAPNSGSASGLLSSRSPLALILCVGAAMAYLS